MIALRTRGELADAARWLALLAALALGAAAVGWLIAHGHVKYLAVVGAVVGVVVLAVRAPGPLAALLLLAVMNGIPFIDLSGRLPGGAHIQDGAVIALIALLYAYRGVITDPRLARISRAATIWGACFAGYWLITLMRSWLLDGIPVVKAALFGRDFLYFAVLLPVAMRAELPSRSLRCGFGVLVAGLALFAGGAVATSLTGAAVPWLVHPIGLADQVGLTRVYSMMSDLVNAGFIFATAYVLCNRSGRYRSRIALLSLLLGVASVLQLTRANYFALGVGLLVALGVWVHRYATLRPLLVRTSVALLVVGALVLVALGSGLSSSPSPAAGVIARVQSGIVDFSNSTGTVGYRETIDREMLEVLGDRWPVGLGFLHPSAHYISTLPSGTIRNADTGLLNILMTMGGLGLLSIYAPLAYGLRVLLKRGSRRGAPGVTDRRRWLTLGAAAWLGFAVAGSVTLILLFDVSGLVLTALLLASVARTHSSMRPSTPPEPSCA